MKIQARNTDSFIKSPDPAARVILVYGPDDGLMRNRIKTLGKTIVEDLNDPFNVSVFKNEDLIDDPERLPNEANTPSMMGGQRLIRIEDSKDSLSPTLKAYLENPSQDSLVIIEAGDLGPPQPLACLVRTSQKRSGSSLLRCRCP